MAEAFAVLGLISSIASLVDISAKVVSRVQEFTSKTTDVPETFRSLAVQLPLLTTTVNRIKAQAKTGTLPDDVATALKIAIDGLLAQLSVVRLSLDTVIPPHDASKLRKALKALQSLAMEDQVRQATEKIHRSIDILVFHQTTQHVDTGDRILQELSKLRLSSPDTANQFGLCMLSAPQIEPDAFKGRSSELQHLRDLLIPAHHARQQQIVSIVGMGGMGKTQLSLAHVRQCVHEYTSVFWVDARDEASLRRELAALAALIYSESNNLPTRTVEDEKVAVSHFRQWLSKPGNDQWLLICDNYDDPKLPGVSSATGYDIRPFFPISAQGTILITTRSTKLAFSKSIHLSRLEDMSTSVAILSQRSRRDLSRDMAAHDLARRLGGLPLALSTAGTYLMSTGMSCNEYLDMYGSMWREVAGENSDRLYEYEARTLSSTWQISVNQIKSQNEDAIELLKFFAFFSPTDIWYELVKADTNSKLSWLNRVTSSGIVFHYTMSQLYSYSLVDMVAGSYQVHPCLHDWLLEVLGDPPDARLFYAALTRVASNIPDKTDPQYWMVGRRLFEHIGQFESPRLRHLWEIQPSEESFFDAVHRIGNLASDFDQYTQAERMFRWVLTGREKVLGPNHMSTLTTMNDLAQILIHQDKREEAERMYLRALRGGEMALGVDHKTTLGTVQALGSLYIERSKLDKAEEMLLRALTGREKTFGMQHITTLETVSTLGSLYQAQDKLSKAEQMYMRALAGREAELGSEHTTTMNTMFSIGRLYSVQDKYGEAEQMYRRVLTVREKALGPEHTGTIAVVYAIGSLYLAQRKFDQAERMYVRVLDGREKTFGSDHSVTMQVVHALGALYASKEDYDAAEEMYKRAMVGYRKILEPDHHLILLLIQSLATLYQSRPDKYVEAEQKYMEALAGYERTLGPEHSSTLDTVNNLGLLYYKQDKLNQAEEMYLRALNGYEKLLGPEHSSTLDAVDNIARLYYSQDKPDQAEHMYLRALAGYEKVLGPEHSSAINVADNLGSLYYSRGKPDQAEQMYLRALAGYEKTLGLEHDSTLDVVGNLAALYYYHEDDGKLDQAEQMYRRLCSGYEKTKGPDDKLTITAKRDLGFTIRNQNKLKQEARETLSTTTTSNPTIVKQVQPRRRSRFSRLLGRK